VGWRLTSAQWPEEEKFERKVGDHYFVLEVHSSAIDDASLDHIRVPIEWAPLKVGDYELPAHSGALVPAYLASHLLKHHEKPLLWALDITTLWESLNESEKTAALTAASDAGLSKHLDWAVRLAESIIEVADRGPEAAGAIRIIQRALAVRSDFGRVAQLVVLSASPGAALRVIGGRVWPPAWRQGWRAAPSYFTRRAVAWAYRHLVFELPASASQSTVGELALSFDDEDCAPRLMAALRESGAVWVSSIGQSMAPAVPLFGYARIVAMADRMLKIGDVVAIRSSERQCALERVLRLEEDCVLVKPDAPLSKEHRVSRDTVLGICDMVQVGDSRVPIERRPYGNLDMLRAIVRSRFGTRSAVKRLMYVFDYEGAKLSRLESLVEFREAPKDSLGRENLPADAGEERGAVVGLLDGVTVYRASYVRAEANRLRNAPKSWSPRGRILFLHGGTTEPEFRRRGVHSAATRWLLNNERASDVAHAVCFVHADNLAARRTVEGAGFRLVGPVDE
jgi:ribosomal protein S18 acetylase RimI-like enzyme